MLWGGIFRGVLDEDGWGRGLGEEMEFVGEGDVVRKCCALGKITW